MNDLSNRLAVLMPDLESLVHYEVSNDGSGDSITMWNPPDGRPEPTEAELLAVDPAGAAVANENRRRNGRERELRFLVRAIGRAIEQQVPGFQRATFLADVRRFLED